MKTDVRLVSEWMEPTSIIPTRKGPVTAPAGSWELWHVACPQCGAHELRPRSEERYLRAVNRAYWARR